MIESKSVLPRSKKWQKSLDRISQETQKGSDYWEKRVLGENIKVKTYLNELFSNYSQPKILDVGAGIFWKSYIPEEYWDSTTVVDWVDNKNEKNLVVADIEEQLPFDDETFDIVLSKELFAHLEEWNKSLSEMGRVLKGGGLLAVIESEGHQIDEKTRFSVFDPEQVKKDFKEIGLGEVNSQVIERLNTGLENNLTAVIGKK